MRILELGPYAGEWTLKLSKYCDQIVAVEGKKINCDYIESLKIRNAKVVYADLDTFDITSLGKFDVIFARGILYHLEYPWRLVAQLTQMSDYIIGWSHYAEKIEGQREGYSGRGFIEPQSDRWQDEAANHGSKSQRETQTNLHPSGKQQWELTSGLCECAWWLTPSEFWRMFHEQGFALTFPTPLVAEVNGGLSAHFEAVRRPYSNPMFFEEMFQLKPSVRVEIPGV